MKKLLVPVAVVLVLSSCAGSKTASVQKNFDDAYFQPSQIDNNEVYGQIDPAAAEKREIEARLAVKNRTTRSYGQSYSDRMRNFRSSGNGSMQPIMAPRVVYNPWMNSASMYYGYNPYYNPYMGMGMNNPYGMMGYNPYGFNNYGCSPYGSYNPYSYGYNNYGSGNSWMYWNQVNNPYMYGNSWGGSNSSNSNWTGGWKGNSSPANTNTPQGPRRSTYNSGMSTGSTSGSSTGIGSSGSSGTSGSSGGRQTTWGTTSDHNSGSAGSSGGRQTTWSTGSGSSSSGGGMSSGSSSNGSSGGGGRRR